MLKKYMSEYSGNKAAAVIKSNRKFIRKHASKISEEVRLLDLYDVLLNSGE